MANNLHKKEPHGSVRCERVHPTFPHDGWTNLHDGKWCTFVHTWTDHKSYEMNTPQTIKDLSEMVKPNQLGMKIIEEQEQNLEQELNRVELDIETDLAMFIGQYKLDTETTEEYSKKYPQNEPLDLSNFSSQTTEYLNASDECKLDMTVCKLLFNAYKKLIRGGSYKGYKKEEDIEKECQELVSEFNVFLDINLKISTVLLGGDPEVIKIIWGRLPALSVLQKNLHIRINKMNQDLSNIINLKKIIDGN